MKMNVKQYAQLWLDSLNRVSEKDRPAVSQAMLTRMLKDGMYHKLHEVLRTMEQLFGHGETVERVTVISARIPQETEVKKIVAGLLGHERFSLTYKQDESLIGGLIVQTRDQRWDLTLKHQLRRLQKTVTV